MNGVLTVHADWLEHGKDTAHLKINTTGLYDCVVCKRAGGRGLQGSRPCPALPGISDVRWAGCVGVTEGDW